MDFDPKPVVVRFTDDGVAETGGRGIFLGNDTMSGHTAIHVASLSNWRLISVEANEDNTVWMRFEETPVGAAEALVANVHSGVIVQIESHPEMNLELRTVFIGMTESEMSHHLAKLGWRRVGLARGFVFFTKDIVLKQIAHE